LAHAFANPRGSGSVTKAARARARDREEVFLDWARKSAIEVRT
jgi:hypothetical protein